MLLSAIPRSSSNSLLLLRNHTLTSTSSPTANNLLSTPTTLKPLLRAPTVPPASSVTTSSGNLENPIHHVTHSLSDGDDEEAGGGSELVSSASAVASAIRKGSGSPVEFVQKMEQGHNINTKKTKLVLPSPDFQRLCVQQLDLFRRIVDPDAILSVYVRPAGSYVMDRLELRRVTSYPGVNASSSDIVILVANFNIPTGLRSAEAALSSKQAECVAEHRAVVFPMVKHPFIVGFLVAELPMVEMDISCVNGENDLISPVEAYASSSASFKKPKSWSIQTLNDEPSRMFNFTAEQRLNAIDISHTLAMAYVMDQKALLLQQSSWQNNVRMTTLVEQIRGPLSSIRTLSKMLSIHTKRSEIAYDIVEDIMVQGDSMRDALQELQDAVYLTKGLVSGVCCVTALIEGQEVVVSNLGDCRAVLSRGGVAEALTEDHRAAREDERKRIEDKGGYVEIHRGAWRVHGILSVSRSIGDAHLKDWVLAEPDTKILKLSPDMEFLVLASDGLWDEVGNQEAVDIVISLCKAEKNVGTTGDIPEDNDVEYGCVNVSPSSKLRRISLVKQQKESRHSPSYKKKVCGWKDNENDFACENESPPTKLRKISLVKRINIKTESPVKENSCYRKRSASAVLGDACKELGNLAVSRGSLDDITVMIIDLNHFRHNS